MSRELNPAQTPDGQPDERDRQGENTNTKPRRCDYCGWRQTERRNENA